jgi:hypothetical protein
MASLIANYFALAGVCLFWDQRIMLRFAVVQFRTLDRARPHWDR